MINNSKDNNCISLMINLLYEAVLVTNKGIIIILKILTILIITIIIQSICLIVLYMHTGNVLEFSYCMSTHSFLIGT